MKKLVGLVVVLLATSQAWASEVVYDNLDVIGMREVERKGGQMWTNERIKEALAEPGSHPWYSTNRPSKLSPEQQRVEQKKVDRFVSYSNCVEKIKGGAEYNAVLTMLQNTAGDGWRLAAKHDPVLSKLFNEGLDRCDSQAEAREGDWRTS